MFDYIWLIPVLPLIGFVINGLIGSRLNEKVVGLIGCTTVFISFLISVACVIKLAGLPVDERTIEYVVWTWIETGGFLSQFGLQLDPLSAVMILVVSGVGFLIHVYSVGYMHGETGYFRFFAYLNLFTFSMLTLVLGNNFLIMFVGWELVGLCSYLLIGYYYEKKSAGDAGKKAFITNRVGDFGMVLAVMLIFFFLGTVDFTEVFEKAPHTFEYGGIIVTLIALFLFLAATGKSAQIPLYVWLPDAMEGPTPVSALIHAATMVTAGVYMIARCAQIFILAPTALMVVAIVGALTALYAATIGLLQNDIKKVLAYSTISQLGYMFIGVGVASFGAGIFHLMTHAFFKACLFLGSGSVIHAMSGEQDMRKMGALRKHMPWTFWTFLISTMAIAGFPPLSGFFSKDEILWKAFSGEHGHPLIWLVGAIAAGLTAFYMFRLVFMTFYGKSRVEPEVAHHLHESPKTMTMPLAILAILALFGGFIGMPHIFGVENKFEKWLEPAVHVTVPPHAEEFASAAPGGHDTVSDETINSEHGTVHGEADAHGAGSHGNVGLEWLMMIVSVIIALAGFTVAFIMYIKKPDLPGKLAQKAKGLYNVVYNKYFVDEIYQATAIEGTYKTSRFFSWFDGKVIDGTVRLSGNITLLISQIDNLIDKYIVDGMVNGLGGITRFLGSKIRLIQTGNLQNYIFYVFYGTLLIIIYKIIFQ